MNLLLGFIAGSGYSMAIVGMLNLSGWWKPDEYSFIALIIIGIFLIIFSMMLYNKNKTRLPGDIK